MKSAQNQPAKEVLFASPRILFASGWNFYLHSPNLYKSEKYDLMVNDPIHDSIVYDPIYDSIAYDYDSMFQFAAGFNCICSKAYCKKNPILQRALAE